MASVIDDALVLIAEDAEDVRALLRIQLAERGYRTVEAADGAAALSRAAETRPDVILLDIGMPQLDGYEVLRRLRDDPDLADVPVVFLTGRAAADDAVQGLESGAHDYLRKPFEAAELTARVHAALRTKRLRDELRAANDEFLRLACTDQLTGTPNRRLLDDELRRHCSRAKRHGRPLAVLLVDVDGFKAINDGYGHPGGDQALIGLARRLQERLRAEDVLGRWGGEEFMVITPDVDGEGAGALAEALRRQVEVAPFVVAGHEVPITVSVGWAEWEPGEVPDGLVRRADKALYRAKRSGRNRSERG